MRISADGNDMYICQVCGRDLDSVKFPPQWRPDITGRNSAGNVCPPCVQIDVQERCKNNKEIIQHGKLDAKSKIVQS